MTRDPRSEAEKARADLARNAELGLAVPESPAEQQPSVTPQTFGERHEAYGAEHNVGVLKASYCTSTRGTRNCR